MINNAKQRFPCQTQFSEIWMKCEQELLFDRMVFNRKWGIAEQAVTNLRAFDETEAELR